MKKMKMIIRNRKESTPVIVTDHEKVEGSHGSRSGAACMVGATLGWFLGCIFAVFTKQPAWLIVMPSLGIILGVIVGPMLLPKGAPNH